MVVSCSRMVITALVRLADLARLLQNPVGLSGIKQSWRVVKDESLRARLCIKC